MWDQRVMMRWNNIQLQFIQSLGFACLHRSDDFDDYVLKAVIA